MNYEAIESAPAGSPQFTDETFQTIKFQVNTKVNVVGNAYTNILKAVTCSDSSGVAIWYTMPADQVSTIYAAAQSNASAWVAENYPNT